MLRSVLDTEISPELIPDEDPDPTRPGSDSESVVGPYELQDFFLYYTLRFGYRPSKVAFLAHHAWRDRELGRVAGPDPAPSAATSTRSREIKHWLEVFLDALLRHQPVQALGDPQRAEGRLRRLAVAARRLARAQRLAPPTRGSRSCATTCPTT